MDKETSWEPHLEEIYRFARLHQWVSQLDDIVERFLQDFSQNHQEIAACIRQDHFSASQNRVDSLVSLVLLYGLGIPACELTEHLYRCLYGKLDSKDQQFLIQHFFKGTLPLSPDDSHEIIIRSFISYKRAIYRGMQIENLVSNVNPAETALFLTVLICRLDVHTQNRALINLLLYRIEAELPENVLQGVLSYLKKLRNIIYEVYTRGQSVLSDELNIADESRLFQVENDVYDRPDDPNQNNEEQTQTAESSVSSPEQLSADKTSEGHLEYAEIPDADRSAGQESGGVENIRKSSLISPGGSSSADQKRSEASRGRENVRDEGLLADASIRPDRNEGTKAESFSGNGSAGTEGTGFPGLVQGGEFDDFDSSVLLQPDDSGNNLFQVSFNKSIEKLLDLLGEEPLPLQEQAGNEKKKDKNSRTVPAEGGEPEPSRMKAVIGQRDIQSAAGHVKNRRYLLPVLFSGTALLMVFLVFTLRDNGKTVVDARAAGSIPVPEASVSLPESQPVLPNPRNQVRQLMEDSLPAEAGEEIVEADIRFENGVYLWRVQEGESIWKMYLSGRNSSGLYSIPAEVHWHSFLSSFRALNPMLLNPDIIYPGNLLRLPAADTIPVVPEE